MPTRIQIARRDVFAHFDRLPTGVLNTSELQQVLSQNREHWRLSASFSFQAFVDYLSKNGKLRRFEFAFPVRKEVRFAWGDVPFERVLMTLKPRCHFSHYSAARMHDLTEQDSKTIYVNVEQPPKPSSSSGLEQDRVRAAFARKPRVTNNIAKIGGRRVVLLNGKNTGYLGVESRQIQTPFGPETVRVTDLERTLIDIAVRPFYSGGVGEVQKAYERAAPFASANRLAALLKQLAYVYPYHQAIGYYMEQSGAYSSESLDLFRTKFEYQFDFYLTYAMKETRYDERWRLFVPEGM